MITTERTINNYDQKIEIKVHCKDIFNGPFTEFEQTGNSIKFKRFYAEDARYASKTELQNAVEVIYELAETNFVNLRLWGRVIYIPKNASKFEIQEILIEFIIKNANFVR